MVEYVCKKCGSNKIELKKQGIHEGIYCKDCGCWIKWVKKDAEKTDSALRKQLIASGNDEKQATTMLNNTSSVPVSDLLFEPNTPENSSVEPEKNISILVHGPVELEFSDGRRIWLSDNSRVVFEDMVIKEYKIATNELIREITYY